ncbi:hypothetical protein RD792_003085 [Penstemon davidsonii]|uniref:Protein kinase domain-containing protein n=1 Tax=Penstemon davidsonii TaxID=160366 RepID=A0ABR0DST5_9LAMI|nr:hypothetical protein RD792_003085 [Penstemon davidsonii]
MTIGRGWWLAAVIRKEELWQLCHQHSRTPSLMSSFSSDFTSSSRLSSFSDAYFDYEHNLHSSKHHMALSFQDLVGTKIDLSQEGKETKLVFFKDSRVEFGLEELLTSSTYVLGEKIDSFWRTFVVCLRNDIIEKIVVKRFEIGNVAWDQLEKRIEIIGSINNDNVAKLWGYYLCDSGNRVILDSETRFKIAINVAKGLAHVHELCDGKFVHGNINASNIFINSQEYQCCLGDLGTVNFQITGYHSPEFSSRKKASQASDIYCFGVFLIELVSDRSPTLSSCMSCVARMPEQRAKIVDVVKMVVGIRSFVTGKGLRLSRVPAGVAFHTDWAQDPFPRSRIPSLLPLRPEE